jgi:hypothetical protein
MRLHSFQNDFSKTHNRPIRYHRDIEPVEADKRTKVAEQETARLRECVGKGINENLK